MCSVFSAHEQDDLVKTLKRYIHLKKYVLLRRFIPLKGIYTYEVDTSRKYVALRGICTPGEVGEGNW